MGGRGAAAIANQGADRRKSIAHDQTSGDAVPQCPLDILREPSGSRREVAGEAGAAGAQHLEHFRGGAVHRRSRFLGAARGGK